MINTNDLRRLAQAVIGWSTCNQAWLDQNEGAVAAVVGHIDEEGNTYPVATIDCYQYISEQSLPLAKFYAAANPAAISKLLARIEAAEKERDALRAKIAEMEKQGPVAHVWRCDNGHVHGSCESELLMGQQLYALPGAKGE